MNRAISPKALATREKILRAANDLFYRYGYSATGLDRIITAAGVAKGNFYHHFRNKEELATAVLDWHRDLALTEIGVERILAQPSPLQALLDLLEAMSGRMICEDGDCRVRGCFFGNFALELSTTSEPVRLKVKHIFDGFRDLICRLLERAAEAGEIHSGLDPVSTAGVLLGLMEGAVLLDKTGQSEQQRANALAFVRAYLRR